MQLEGIKAMVFDWDGCLLDTYEETYQAYRRTLAKFDIEIDRDSFRRLHRSDWRQFYVRAGLPESRWDEADKLWKQFYEGGRVSLRQGAKDVLHLLGDRFLLGLVSGGSRARVTSELDSNTLRELFSCIICDDDCNSKKPNMEPLLTCLSKLGVPASRSAYLGDTYEDILMGKRAGVTTILVCSKYTDMAEVQELRPDFTVANLPRIIDLFSS